MVYSFTVYFENEVLRKRPYLKREWCIHVIETPLKIEVRRTTACASGAWSRSWEGES